MLVLAVGPDQAHLAVTLDRPAFGRGLDPAAEFQAELRRTIDDLVEGLAVPAGVRVVDCRRDDDLPYRVTVGEAAARLSGSGRD